MKTTEDKFGLPISCRISASIDDYKKAKSFLGDPENQKELKELLKKPLARVIVGAVLLVVVIYLSRYVFKAVAGSIHGFKDLSQAIKR